MSGDEPRPVSGFGNLRVKVWLATHRSLSQPSHVLHRLSTPRHPPGTLSNLTTFLSRSLARELFQDSFIRCVTTFLKLSKIAFPVRCAGPQAAGAVPARDTGGSGTGPTLLASASSTGPADARTSVLPSCAPGGGDRDRTCDPLLAKQELYH